MPIAQLSNVRLHYRVDGDAGSPPLLLSNSLGASLEMWEPQIAALAGRFRVIRYDSRGHGESEVTPGPYSIEQLAGDALGLLDALSIGRAHCCGLSMGGMVAMWMGINAPKRVDRLVLANTAAKIGTAETWNARIDAVRKGGTASIAPAVLARWFSPALLEQPTPIIARLRATFERTSAAGYAASCAAVRDTDLRHSLGRIHAPALVIAGTRRHGHASGRWPIRRRSYFQCALRRAARRASVEHPGSVGVHAGARAIPDQPHRSDRSMNEQERFENGLEVRRAVLGDAHVDRSLAKRNEFNEEFQALITRYAWGEIWTRPGLSRHTRSLLTIGLMVALNRSDEFKLHLRAAFNNGVTRDEIREVLLHCAIYAGVPAANSAFHMAEEVFAQMESPSG